MRNTNRLFLTACLGALLVCRGASAEERPLRQIIDAEIRAAYQRENVQPAGPASDAAFLRRVYLDVLGTIPTHEQASQFLNDKSEDKRARLIDRLLEDPRYARHQADVWDLLFFGRNPNDRELTGRRDGFQKWLTDQFAQNVPYDRLVRDLLLGEGHTDQGPAMFYAQFRGQPEEAGDAVSRLFLGTQLRCARCHDHPYEKWKQEDFYGLAGFFVRLTFVDVPRNGKRSLLLTEKSSGEMMFSGSAKEQRPGQKGKPLPARFLGGAVLEEPPLPADFKEPNLKGVATAPAPLFSRKAKLAEWLTAADNPYFARAAANRIWAQFMGRGLVQPVDDLGSKKTPSHPALLQALADDLVASRLDLKHFIREIVNSETYQLASTGPATEAAPLWYERARVRPLSAEELMSAMRVATGFDATDSKAEMPGKHYLLQYFGEPSDGRGDFQPSLNEHLFLNNSGDIRALVQRRKGNLADVLRSSTDPWESRVERLYLSLLTRPPRPEESKRFVAYLTAKPEAANLVEDAIWVLLNCAEFRFNH
jgi:Protein of unknown function (DUF1549)/Protein of unknown function (DUF1553)